MINKKFNIEIWKRKNARLAFYWNCDKFEENQVELPKFKSIKNHVCMFCGKANLYTYAVEISPIMMFSQTLNALLL